MAEKAEGHLLRVLLVDDHRMFAESLSRLLSDEPDIEVVGIATSGAEALAVAPRLLPQVALVDFRMPDQDGVATAAALKKQNPQLMIVMLTGDGDDRTLLAAIEAGCSGFLTKDRAASEVAAAVRMAAAGEALISPALLARLLPQLHPSHHRIGADLTEREREVLGYLALGWTNRAIATSLHLSVNTVRNYAQSVLTKLGAHSKLEAVATAVRTGIIEYPSRA